MAFSWADTAWGSGGYVGISRWIGLVTSATYSNDEPVRVADQEQRDIVDEDGVEDQV